MISPVFPLRGLSGPLSPGSLRGGVLPRLGVRVRRRDRRGVGHCWLYVAHWETSTTGGIAATAFGADTTATGAAATGEAGVPVEGSDT